MNGILNSPLPGAVAPATVFSFAAFDASLQSQQGQANTSGEQSEQKRAADKKKFGPEKAAPSVTSAPAPLEKKADEHSDSSRDRNNLQPKKSENDVSNPAAGMVTITKPFGNKEPKEIPERLAPAPDPCQQLEFDMKDKVRFIRNTQAYGDKIVKLLMPISAGIGAVGSFVFSAVDWVLNPESPQKQKAFEEAYKKVSLLRTKPKLVEALVQVPQDGASIKALLSITMNLPPDQQERLANQILACKRDKKRIETLLPEIIPPKTPSQFANELLNLVKRNGSKLHIEDALSAELRLSKGDERLIQLTDEILQCRNKAEIENKLLYFAIELKEQVDLEAPEIAKQHNRDSLKDRIQNNLLYKLIMTMGIGTFIGNLGSLVMNKVLVAYGIKELRDLERRNKDLEKLVGTADDPCKGTRRALQEEIEDMHGLERELGLDISNGDGAEGTDLFQAPTSTKHESQSRRMNRPPIIQAQPQAVADSAAQPTAQPAPDTRPFPNNYWAAAPEPSWISRAADSVSDALGNSWHHAMDFSPQSKPLIDIKPLADDLAKAVKNHPYVAAGTVVAMLLALPTGGASLEVEGAIAGGEAAAATAEGGAAIAEIAEAAATVAESGSTVATTDAIATQAPKAMAAGAGRIAGFTLVGTAGLDLLAAGKANSATPLIVSDIVLPPIIFYKGKPLYQTSAQADGYVSAFPEADNKFFHTGDMKGASVYTDGQDFYIPITRNDTFWKMNYGGFKQVVLPDDKREFFYNQQFDSSTPLLLPTREN